MTCIRLVIAAVGVFSLAKLTDADGHGGHHKKVIIHVPYKVKTIHHTHTVYKHVKGHEGGGGGGGGDHEYYKVIGYSGGIDDGEIVDAGHGHGGGGGGGGGFGHGFGGGFGGGHASGGDEGGYSAGYEGGYSGGGHATHLSAVGESHGDDYGGYSSGGQAENLISSHSSEGGHDFGGLSSYAGGYGGGGGGGGGGDLEGYENYKLAGLSDEVGGHSGYD